MTSIRDALDPELLEAYDRAEGFALEDLPRLRTLLHAQEAEALRPDPDVQFRDLTIPGPADHPELLVRLFTPARRGDGALPVVVFFHGGGFLFGTRFRHQDLCCRYAKHVGCAVISVEYRLAPEHKAPAQAEDGYAALCWAAEHGGDLGLDPRRIVVAGVSAGGNLAAAVVLLARDRGGPRIALQMPLSAELDHTMSTPSAREIKDPKVWSYGYSQVSWRALLPEGQSVTGYMSPAAAEELRGLPPLFAYVGGLDPFRDENVDYWERLRRAGVFVEARVYPGCFHCFELKAPEAACARDAYDASYRALRQAFGLGA